MAFQRVRPAIQMPCPDGKHARGVRSAGYGGRRFGLLFDVFVIAPAPPGLEPPESPKRFDPGDRRAPGARCGGTLARPEETFVNCRYRMMRPVNMVQRGSRSALR